MKRLFEALSHKKVDIGQMKYSESDWKDPHVVAIIDHVSKATGKPVSEVKKKMEEMVKKQAEMAELSPLIAATTFKNAVESAAFHQMEDVKDLSSHLGKDHVEFDEDIFMDLWDLVRANHKQFSPLRDFQTKKYLMNPQVIFVPSRFKKYQEKYGSIDTAAATPDGVFIFNTEFMQRLLDFAVIKDLKPKNGPNGKKYQANGGKYPNGYAYIEFLIMHELLHYSYGDFHYQKTIPKADPTVINYVGDFRSNHILLKSGYEQLPIGLFSETVNLDRQLTYRECYDLVEEELKKIREKMAPPNPDGGEHPDEKQPRKIHVGMPVQLPNGSFGRVKSIDGNSTEGYSVTSESHPNANVEIEEISKEEANKIAEEQRG
jgi:hypothetical protein